MQKSKSFDYLKSNVNSNNSDRHKLSSTPYTAIVNNINELPLYEGVEFSRHSRSNSIRSVSSSCSSTSSSVISDMTASNSTGGNSYFYSSTPINSPTSGKRQRVNSDICRSSASLNSTVDDSQYYNNLAAQRTLSCSPPQSRKSTTKYRNRCNSTASHIQTRTPWTPDEDELLQKGYEQGLSWAMISATYLPHRSRGCCWGRFKTLQSKNVIGVYQQRICQRPWKASNIKEDN